MTCFGPSALMATVAQLGSGCELIIEGLVVQIPAISVNMLKCP